MSDATPEVSAEPVTDPAPEPEPSPVVVCPTPDAAAYRTRKQAEVVASMSRQLQAVQCPVGHWHTARRVVNPDAVPVTPPEDPESGEPVPAPTEPPVAETEPGGAQRRGASSSRKR